MIIWLASYPKSGNTLLRSILATYFFSVDGSLKFEYLYKIEQFPSIHHFENLGIDLSNDKEVFKNFIEAQKLINKEKNKIKFIKTHSSLSKINNCNFTDLDNTLGAIYVVRDPRNVVKSFAHHNNLNTDEATNAMTDQTRWLVKTDKVCKTFLSSWNVNYNSWKQLNNKVLFIKYEDLVEKKKTTLIKIFKFIKNLGMKDLQLDMIKLNKVIKSTEFNAMQDLEKIEGFQEGVIDSKTKIRKIFFKFGPKNNWKKNLDNKNRKIIEKKFNKEMVELGYL
tara:strand:+ start:360 stop:1196 length:837 start_codon:yes stop_codon:yes gene_type:complete